MECVSVRPPDFVVNTLLTSDLGIGELFAGDWKAGHKAACESYLRFHGAPISERRNLVVASCGGSPKDIDMIQSHKSIQYCCRALLPGGALILLAECTDGYGSPNFEGFFPIHKIESHLDAVRSNKRPNGQTALALHQRATEHTVYFISRLPEDVVQDMGLIPRKSLEGAVAAATEAGFGSGRAYIIPAGADTIPFLR
jgi:nickel-dependent lactate racemase